MAHGARFLVSPVADEVIIRRATELGVASIPGGHTPTELLAAHRAGAPLVKLFPAPAGGPAWLRSLLAPLPFLKVVPTNGVDLDNAADWLAAGAWALGFVARYSKPTTCASAASIASRRGRGRSSIACGRRACRSASSGADRRAAQPPDGTSCTSKSVGQSLPVRRKVFVSGRQAMPLRTASSAMPWPISSSRSGEASMRAVTRPVAGSMRTISSVVQMLA